MRTLIPGAGFNGPTAQPTVAGMAGMRGYEAKAIARWDVVPYQDVVGVLRVGVVAFHIAGIQYVGFSLNGGPEVRITEMTRNPDTGVVEYHATFDPALVATDGEVEIRAIVQPNVGIARLLQDSEGRDLGERSLRLFAATRGALPNSGVQRWIDPRHDVAIINATGTFPTKAILRGRTSGSLGFVEGASSGPTLTFSRYQVRQKSLNSNFVSGEEVTTSTKTMRVGNIQERIAGTWTSGGNITKGLIIVGVTSGAEGIVSESVSSDMLKFVPTKGTFLNGELVADQPNQNRVRATVETAPIESNDGITATLASVPAPRASVNADGSESNPYGSIEDFFQKFTGFMNGSDRATDGVTVYLKEGTYTYASDFFTDYASEGRAWWQAAPGPASNRWFVLAGAPGTPKSKIVLTSLREYSGGRMGVVGQRKLRLKSLTLTQTTNAPVLANVSSPFGNHFWLDNVSMIGLGYNNWYNRSIEGMVSSDGPFFATDLSIDSAISCLSGVIGRNINAQNLGGDFINYQGLTINANLRNLDIPVAPGIFPPGGGVHPDVVQTLNTDNQIVYGLNAFDVTAQGITVTGSNFALVNYVVKQNPTDTQAAWISGLAARHMLYWNVTLGTHVFQLNTGGQRDLSIRNSVMRLSSFAPGVDMSGWEVENNHFIPMWNSTGSFGTHSTVGDPGFADFNQGDLSPGVGSVLLPANRPVAPTNTSKVDVNGDLRGAVSAIGAYKGPSE